MERFVDGRRRIQPPLRFGFGVLWHLLRYGRRYDVVHTAATPFFGLLAAALLRPVHRYKLVVDWHEVWTLGYWQEYLGHLGGRVAGQSNGSALILRSELSAFRVCTHRD